MKHPLYIIVAADKNNGIGKNGKLPWHFREDLQYFKKVTTKTEDPNKQNMLIMGQTTWESLPEKIRPLTGRKNVILSSNPLNVRGIDKQGENIPEIYDSFEKAFESAGDNIEKIFIIGGASIYAQALKFPYLEGIYLTKIRSAFECDTFLAEIPERFKIWEKIDSKEENGIILDFFFIS